MSPIEPRVVDLYHGDVLHADAHRSDPALDFKAMAGAGIWGLIHKATQGAGTTDRAYGPRTRAARAAGLLTGAYHFNTGDNVTAQVSHFLDAADPDAATLMCLDFEDNRASQMTLAQAALFLQLADEKLGRPCWLYGGNRPKQMLANASAELRTLFGKRPWWLCQYGQSPSVLDFNRHPLPWHAWTLWQFTGDGLGPPPHALPGVVTQGIDLSAFTGTREQLAQVWAGSTP